MKAKKKENQEHGKYFCLEELAKAGIFSYIDDFHCQNYGSAHNKTMIIDSSTLITGSFNFTTLAETTNAENLLVIKNAPNLIKDYINNYSKHKKHAKQVEKDKTLK